MNWIRPLFWVAAAYDGILGVAFIVAGPALFAAFAMTPPNHWGYIHFPAGLLIVFAFMFAAVARRPQLNRNLIPYGIGLKGVYCTAVFFHWFSAGIPWVWKPFAFIDLAFGVLFWVAWTQLRPHPE